MQSLLTSKNVTWTNYGEPAPEELATVVREAQLLPLDAEFIAQNHHRPEVTVRPAYVLLLLHVPVFNKQTRVTTSASLYLIIRDSKLTTLQYEQIAVLDRLLQDFAETPEKQEEYFEDGALGLAIHVITTMYGGAFHKLERLHKHINIAEDAVFQGNERKMVEEISILVRDVMDFRKIIRPQRELFTTLPVHPLFTEPTAASWQRLHGQVNKLWDFLESLSEAVLQLSETNQTLLQHKQNQLLRVLTYYSIAAIPVFVISSVLVPRGPEATTTDQIVYWALVVLLLLIPLGIFWRFRKKNVF